MSDPPRGGLSLYDNLLDPNASNAASATISSAPVLYNQSEAPAAGAAAKKPVDPALRFQPIRRPQAKQAAKPKPSFPKAIPKPAAADSAANTVAEPTSAPAPTKSTLADWAAADDDDIYYDAGGKRQRGGRKKKKRKQEREFVTDWNDIYDPTRPTNVEEYLRSDERISEVREWKALLYKHRKRPDASEGSDEDDEHPSHTRTNQFAPPSSYNFAPPPQSPPAPLPDDKSGEDVYARRLALSQAEASQHDSPPPPPPPADEYDEPQQRTIDSTTISRAPVRYAQPTAVADDNDYDDPPRGLGSSSTEQQQQQGPPDDATVERSSRPGQAGFAARLMTKYGWAKGSGLGADESGIVNPLRVQVDKRRKKADADGGGWAEPGGKGKIIGSRRHKEETGKFGTMSEVIVLRNMLENMPDLQAEIASGLGQEIGEECGEKYGRVERLYIDQESRQVFIKFTDQVSALRAVNELDGRVFNGNLIAPKFYDTETFEKGVYR